MTTPAALAVDSPAFNYYPNAMIRLAGIIAYQDPSTIKAAVRDQLPGQRVVWGPVRAFHDEISDSLMYVVRRDQPHEPAEYTVVIRGTHMDSWYSWEMEDFAVGATVPFQELASGAPNSGKISQGTFRGMQLLLEMRDPETKQSLEEFLRHENPEILIVTGHSLGGTLTPVMFAYLSAAFGGGWAPVLAMFSFAGLTPGDGDFNRYLDAQGLPELRFRYHNTLDIAPLLWGCEPELHDIYTSNGLSWGFPENDVFGKLFGEAAGKGYAQPLLGGVALTGEFDGSHFIDKHMWGAQALHQHHGSTYQTLINTAFRYTEPLLPFTDILQPQDAPAA